MFKFKANDIITHPISHAVFFIVSTHQTGAPVWDRSYSIRVLATGPMNLQLHVGQSMRFMSKELDQKWILIIVRQYNDIWNSLNEN